MSRPVLLAGGTSTYVQESGSDSDIQPDRRFSVFNQPRRTSSLKPSSAVTAEPALLREKRMKHLLKNLHTVEEEAQKAGMPSIAGKIHGIHEQVARRDEATVPHPALIEEYQPTPEPEEPEFIPVSKPPSRRGSKLNDEWTNNPNARARRIVERYRTTSEARERIKQELGEPEYAFRDTEIRDGLWQIMDKMERFATKFFSFESNDKDRLTRSFRLMTPETIKVIGCVASGGPGGQDGWRDLFFDEQQRRALVCAIIGNVLVEQVFQHAFFGGTMADFETLSTLQERLRDEDGKFSTSLPPHNILLTNP